VIRKWLTYFLLSFFGFLLFGCSQIVDTKIYEDTSNNFFKNLKENKPDSCVALMVTENEQGKKIDLDTFKLSLNFFRKAIVEEFGENFEWKTIKISYSFIDYNQGDSIINGQISALVQINNESKFAYNQVTFDKKTKKIYYISPGSTRYPIPNMSGFWLVGLIGVVIIGFIIFSIIKVAKSELKYKWLYYIGILLINFPTVSFGPFKGIYLETLKIVFSMGVKVSHGDYLNYCWSFGLPIVAMFANYKIYRLKKQKSESSFEEIKPPTIEPDLIKTEEEPKEIVYIPRTYKCQEGNLVIEQELHNPNIGEKVFLDNKPAPSGRYKIGFMSYLEVEDGIIVSFD